jgi:hypothetical protein
MQKSLFLLAAAATSLTAHAANGLNFDFNKIADAEYKKLVEPVTTPMRYMFSTPAKSTGILGFDLGVAATFIKLPTEVLDIAKNKIEGGSDIPSSLPVPRLTAQKGLPLGIDLGINASLVPGTDIKLLGGGLQYQIGLPIPLLPVYAAARAGYTTLLGLEELSSTHLNIEGLVSAGMPAGVSAILDIEPWLGIGADFASAKSTIKYTEANATLEIKPEHEWTDKYTMAGVRLSLGFLRVGVEGQFSLDGRPAMYTAKAAIGF